MNDVVRARIDPRLKKSATAVLRRIGLTPSGAFRLMMARIAAEEKLPFDPLVPNKKTIAAIKEARRGKLKSVKRVEELWKALDAEDD
jgi:DNA-damage-inducible protein J